MESMESIYVIIADRTDKKGLATLGYADTIEDAKYIVDICNKLIEFKDELMNNITNPRYFEASKIEMRLLTEKYINCLNSNLTELLNNMNEEEFNKEKDESFKNILEKLK